MIKPTKLQETELQELQDFQAQSEALIAQLGQIGFRKLQLEKDEQYLKQVFDQTLTAENEFEYLLHQLHLHLSL